MDLGKIIALKEMMLEAEDFGDPFDYFFDLMEDDEILGHGKPVKDDLFIKELIKEVAKGLLGKTVIPTRFLLIKMKGIDFYHGGFMIENRLGSVFYFQDVDTGMLALTGPFLSQPTTLMRFSITRLKGKGPFAMQKSNLRWH